MYCACSSGAPLSPNGGGALSPHPLPGRSSFVSPSLPLRLAMGGLCRSEESPPISCIRPHTKGTCSCSGGTPLPPLSHPPLLPLLHALRGVHTLQVAPPSPPSSVPWLHTRVSLCLFGVAPSLPCLPRVVHADGWVFPSPPPSPDCTIGASAAMSGCPPSSPDCAR